MDSSTIYLQNLEILLLNNLNSPVYKLTPEQQTMIQHFVQNSPTVFEKIIDDIRNITKDGNIDLHDIPCMVKLLADSYSLFTEDNLIVFIQYTINLIIDSKFVTLPDTEKQTIETVLNISIQLLKTNIVPKVKSWYSSIYCWK